MTARICRDCKRTKATDAEWQVLVSAGGCDEPECVWGEDRCYTENSCGLIPDAAMLDRIERAKQMRHGRHLSLVAHEHPQKTPSDTVSPPVQEVDLRSDPEHEQQMALPF